MKKESKYQRQLIDKIYQKFPHAIVMKTDPTLKQGIPDLIILHGKRWAALETKRSKDAPHQPNQDYYVKKMNHMSYASFAYPENEKGVLHDLERALGLKR